MFDLIKWHELKRTLWIPKRLYHFAYSLRYLIEKIGKTFIIPDGKSYQRALVISDPIRAEERLNNP